MRQVLHDRDIREPLFEFLEEYFGKIRILEEKTMGRARADLVMVRPNALFGIEIKSDADTYARLSGQVREYDRHYDYNMLVAGSSHGLHILEHVPDHWGVVTVESLGAELDFYVLRQAKKNPHMEWEKKLSILWRSELAHLQKQFGLPKYKEKNKAFVCWKLAALAAGPKASPETEEKLSRQMSELLFERDYTRAAQVLSEYRKGESWKKLKAETNPQKRLALMMEQQGRSLQLRKRSKRRRR